VHKRVNVIDIAKVSTSLAIRDIALGKETDLTLPKKLQMESDILEWVNDVNYTGINLVGFTEYVYGMCGGYAYEAEGIIGTGGIVVNPSSGGSAITIAQYSKFASSGSTTITFSEAINKILLYASRGGIDVGEIIFSGVPTGNQVRWDTNTGTLTVATTVPFGTGEFVRILVI
jgi:hypothetical protein